MTEYMDMKQAFKCGDDDIPFIEEGFNHLWRKTKKELLKSADQGMQLGTVLEYSLSDKWQVQRMYLCEECGKYFPSEECESISGQGTFICDKCNHKTESKVLTAEEIVSRARKQRDLRDVLSDGALISLANDSIKNGQTKEWLRPEQTALRDAVEEWDSVPEIGDGSESRKQRCDALSKVSNAIKNLKPPE